jgi:hypothetical protein
MGRLWWAFSITHVDVKVPACIMFAWLSNASSSVIEVVEWFHSIFVKFFLHDIYTYPCVHVFNCNCTTNCLFSFAHVQMVCATNECDSDSKEWYFLPFKWLPKTFVCDTNKNVTKMGVIIKAIYCSNQVLQMIMNLGWISM